MSQQFYKIAFEFVSTKAYGDSYVRFATIKARTAKEAENIAWLQRVSLFGARGNDNAIDCRAVTLDNLA